MPVSFGAQVSLPVGKLVYLLAGKPVSRLLITLLSLPKPAPKLV